MRRRGCRKERERNEKCRKEKRGREAERERKTYKRESKRSRSGYETNSDLIWRVYDSVFSFFFPDTEMQAGIRLGGGLG